MHAAEWILPPVPDPELERALVAQLRLPRFAARLLCMRQIVSVEEATGFLQPRLRSLSDPFLLPDMQQAVERILRAIDAGEKIALYGDYDVDGVTSVALVRNVLAAYGARASCFLPSRMEEGYGLTPEGVRRCVEEGRPSLLIAVDCGTASAPLIAEITAEGIDVIVVDHHECKEEMPRCTAVVNPKRNGYLAYFCSAGLAFKLAHALLKVRPVAGFDLKSQLDLVAVGTVADLVPLTGENRILVQAGLRQVGRRPGLNALMQVAGARTPLGGSDIAYKLGPRLNAAGRIGTANEALDLLGCDDHGTATRIAAQLDRQNRERQELERQTFQEAVAQVEALTPAPPDRASIVVGSRKWHPGVIGIVASRLARRYHRPTFVVAFDADGFGKGSGRSVNSVSLVAALQRCEALVEQFGGHEQAAGLTLRETAFENFRAGFETAISALASAEDLRARLYLDVELSLAEVGTDLLESHAMLEPFGMGNPQPLFYASGVAPAGEPRVLKEKHLLLQLAQRGRPVSAIYFGGATDPLPRPPWDVAFRIERNEYNGRVTAQVQVQQVRTCLDRP